MYYVCLFSFKLLEGKMTIWYPPFTTHHTSGMDRHYRFWQSMYFKKLMVVSTYWLQSRAISTPLSAGILKEDFAESNGHNIIL